MAIENTFLPGTKAFLTLIASNRPPFSPTEVFRSSEVPFDAIGTKFLWTSLTEAVALGAEEKGEPPPADLEGIDYSPGPSTPYLDPQRSKYRSTFAIQKPRDAIRDAKVDSRGCGGLRIKYLISWKGYGRYEDK